MLSIAVQYIFPYLSHLMFFIIVVLLATYSPILKGIVIHQTMIRKLHFDLETQNLYQKDRPRDCLLNDVHELVHVHRLLFTITFSSSIFFLKKSLNFFLPSPSHVPPTDQIRAKINHGSIKDSTKAKFSARMVSPYKGKMDLLFLVTIGSCEESRGWCCCNFHSDLSLPRY